MRTQQPWLVLRTSAVLLILALPAFPGAAALPPHRCGGTMAYVPYCAVTSAGSAATFPQYVVVAMGASGSFVGEIGYQFFATPAQGTQGYVKKSCMFDMGLVVQGSCAVTGKVKANCTANPCAIEFTIAGYAIDMSNGLGSWAVCYVAVEIVDPETYNSGPWTVAACPTIVSGAAQDDAFEFLEITG